MHRARRDYFARRAKYAECASERAGAARELEFERRNLKLLEAATADPGELR